MVWGSPLNPVYRGQTLYMPQLPFALVGAWGCSYRNKHRSPHKLPACLSRMRTHKNEYIVNYPEKTNRNLLAWRICIHLPQVTNIVCAHTEGRSECPPNHFTWLTGERAPPKSSYLDGPVGWLLQIWDSNVRFHATMTPPNAHSNIPVTTLAHWTVVNWVTGLEIVILGKFNGLQVITSKKVKRIKKTTYEQNSGFQGEENQVWGTDGSEANFREQNDKCNRDFTVDLMQPMKKS